ncbi:hypothetical protein KHU50_009135 [Colletotrichum sp. SAR 10_65]|nr:hypothetical protein KHU50_009135 [Colletotrichum sp. SAR 10_65]
MMLCVFFGLKNTPLSRVAHISHAELNYFHRLAGYVAVLLLTLHAIVYTVHFGRQGRLVQLLKKEDLEGIGAGVAMLVLLMGIARHRRYELFYISHIVAFGAAVILTGLHRPNWAKKIPVVMSFTAGLELVMKSHQGFTRRVDEFSRRHSNRTAWASVDGPYGSLPDPESYDKLVLVAGGSGAAFTFGLMNRMMSRYDRVKTQSVDFIWTVRQSGWFSKFMFKSRDMIF